MKLTLNREYAARHVGVAALFLGLAGWFLYDAVLVYPNLPADDTTHHTTVEFQYSFAALLGIAALVVAFRVWRSWRSTLEWDDEKMWGSLSGGRPLAFSDVERVDSSRWEAKGILTLVAKDGRRVTLDTWHHAGAAELAERFVGGKESEQ